MLFRGNKKGQAVLEMAVFGSLVLLIFGALLSYLQRMNEQQYMQMQAFRKTLKEANSYREGDDAGAGASAQVRDFEHRRLVDLSNNFRKGSPQVFSSSSSVFWAVPKVGKPAGNLMVLAVNDDEWRIDKEVSRELSIEETNFDSQSSFKESDMKEETPQLIATTKSSTLTDTVSTEFIDKNKGAIWRVQQGVYRDASGQYRYDDSQVGNEIKRGKVWETEF